MLTWIFAFIENIHYKSAMEVKKNCRGETSYYVEFQDSNHRVDEYFNVYHCS
jgi:hypothetical protein